jgi:hypothetical protein
MQFSRQSAQEFLDSLLLNLLTDDERAAVEDGAAAVERLIERLACQGVRLTLAGR